MANQRIIMLSLCVVCFVLVGCFKHQVEPIPQSVDPKLMPKLNISSTIAIQAVSAAQAKTFEFCSAGAHAYYGDFNTLSEAAQKVIVDILKEIQVAIGEAAEKTIAVSVIDARCEENVAGSEMAGDGYYKHMAEIKVQVGDNIEKQFKGYQSAGHVFSSTWCVEMAITNAVLEMFHDKEIVDYLEG